MTTASATSVTPPTREAVDALKRDWEQDPCWDLAGTEGFEAYRDELAEFSDHTYHLWGVADLQRKQAYAAKLGIPDNPVLADYIQRLEERVTTQAEQIARLEALP